MENGNERPKNDARAPTEKKKVVVLVSPSLVAAILVRLRQLLVRFLKFFSQDFKFWSGCEKVGCFYAFGGLQTDGESCVLRTLIDNFEFGFQVESGGTYIYEKFWVEHVDWKRHIATKRHPEAQKLLANFAIRVRLELL